MDLLSLYKIKMDLKETVMSPYKVPFNYEMLQEKNKIEPDNASQAFKQYILPDGETLIAVGTEEDFLYDVIECYQNSDQMAKREKKYDFAQETPDVNAHGSKISMHAG